MKICVMGLGYIGLPTAVMFAEYGQDVHGVDINPAVIDSLNKKKPHINEPGLQEKMSEVIDDGKLTVSILPQAADVFILAVPTPITKDKKADLSYVKEATRMILPYLTQGNLVILESTVPPMTIDNHLIPILLESGLAIGEDLFVSHSPERVLPGQLFEELIWNDRIVGGINEESCLKTVLLYKKFVKGNIYMTDARTAEMVKLIENTYRDVNIALANELAEIGEKLNINIWEAITLANYHPRVQIHAPGPGVGGHCIAVDPWFLIEQSPDEAKLISLARNINDSTPKRMVKIIESTINHLRNPTITILGLSYKGNIDDMRESPSLVILTELINRGYNIKIHDPYVKSSIPGTSATLEEAIQDTDCLVILTDHNEYKSIDFSELKDLFHTKTIIDTRNLLNHQLLRDNGFTCLQIGTEFN
ncbi:UDP-N-acetyl-D-mannosaminuronic acid dehydrogenase [Cytobacillus eiseniae]|uniref:UDP-N-acetyl-D-mannosaminuronic acid dehydrogenase n=1 Tax=Cytobacillus eiseniae TaxID=762947 RepID=A0ABS4RBL1_9BACI|nr:nucleotide sugar dehydrogenase [Cytobacillus eiseniae]MBP2240288.1 UDP-N-acetyl-D-mannosaminuronic acid dehydrogenase [Cytobacillus eiseniae]